ncbi:MAG: flagellar basal body P-ring formation chaperone FlgA [Tepidimonas sp.]|nr:flagellar basal body P-ring formation chaperone FlgA [Tepidimonas sp.]
MAAGLATAVWWGAGLAHGQTPPPAAAELGSAPWRAQIGQWLNGEVRDQLREGALPVPLRAEIEVGTLDSRLRLAPCQRVEPHLPPGTRLWGRSRIGLRCTDGPVAWNVFLPIYVRVWGPGWVLRRPVARGETLTAQHAESTEVEWTAHRDSVLVAPQDWVGREAVRGLAAGQVLRSGLVRTPPAMGVGSVVRVRIEGPGFAVTTTGEALGEARVGGPVRVRLTNRRVLTGTVLDAQTVSVPL